jgi:hypothetical protein
MAAFLKNCIYKTSRRPTFRLGFAGAAQVVTMALAATGATFLALPTWVLTTCGYFSFLGGFLFAGMVIALISGMSLLKTGRIVNGGETNDVLATVALYVSIFNLFTKVPHGVPGIVSPSRWLSAMETQRLCLLRGKAAVQIILPAAKRRSLDTRGSSPVFRTARVSSATDRTSWQRRCGRRCPCSWRFWARRRSGG